MIRASTYDTTAIHISVRTVTRAYYDCYQPANRWHRQVAERWVVQYDFCVNDGDWGQMFVLTLFLQASVDSTSARKNSRSGAAGRWASGVCGGRRRLGRIDDHRLATGVLDGPERRLVDAPNIRLAALLTGISRIQRVRGSLPAPDLIGGGR